ncbi:urease accessory protein UreD [Terasakiella sp. A23]|uniref:urease accessory protein UreD n=1 Tax=Terasakiella sp. FCG-A23 TaxID=3080561 RepID=UPI002954EBE3|nr:urease accessory protein UreD [Terasakiella sp. A23]MDV7339580.1 urease accessory protein UreD [Terasakiella sp. A23]
MTTVAAFSNGPKSTTSKRAIEIHGAADVSFTHKDGETRLNRLYYRDPLKVLFPRGDIPTAALVTTGGGLFGGDIYDIDIALDEGAQSLVTAQAAEKVYRSSGPDCEINVNLKVADGACLEWLPQESILFDQARFRRTTKLDLAPEASALVGEIIVFGRLASGEEVQDGLLREAWEVRRDGKLIWADALHMEDDLQRPLNHASAFGGARAIATAVYAGSDAEGLLETAREFLLGEEDVRVGASFVNGLLICRWLAKDPYQLRKSFGNFWSAFRHKALGRNAVLPRLWHC